MPIAESRMRSILEYKLGIQDSPAGWLGPEETKGAPEKSICLRWRSGRKPANPTRKSPVHTVQFESIDLSDVNLDKTSPFERNKKSRPPPIELEHNIR